VLRHLPRPRPLRTVPVILIVVGLAALAPAALEQVRALFAAGRYDEARQALAQVPEDDAEAERAWLAASIYGGRNRATESVVTAYQRYSPRTS